LLLWLSVSLPKWTRRVGARNDISYGVYIYAFPLQQLLVVYGVGDLGYIPFLLASLACTFPVAAGSWYLVERPALKLKSRARRAKAVPAAVPS
jgi:peptidoglycan/LPS O-acetylase OafA/YrhL